MKALGNWVLGLGVIGLGIFGLGVLGLRAIGLGNIRLGHSGTLEQLGNLSLVGRHRDTGKDIQWTGFGRPHAEGKPNGPRINMALPCSKLSFSGINTPLHPQISPSLTPPQPPYYLHQCLCTTTLTPHKLNPTIIPRIRHADVPW